jgi:hypothetical protein
MNVYETIDKLFAQVCQQFQDPTQISSQNIATIMQQLKKQVICTIAIGNQLPTTHIIASLQDIPIFNCDGEIYRDAK